MGFFSLGVPVQTIPERVLLFGKGLFLKLFIASRRVAALVRSPAHPLRLQSPSSYLSFVLRGTTFVFLICFYFRGYYCR